MKWIMFITLTLVSVASGQVINLNSPQSIVPATAQKADWMAIRIYPSQEKMIVDYRWVDGAGEPISVNGRVEQHWVCRDIPVEGENANCTSTGVPHACCTGTGSGSCDDDDMCFSSVFKFPIPGGAVGQNFGVGFRTLLKNAWRDRVLDPGNDGAFE